ncbi:MAG: hypothetical protein NZ822_03315, partial [Patescibacteria group bacterium]|nr:hypothetical protein [Patescibacteria group bacterium]
MVESFRDKDRNEKIENLRRRGFKRESSLKFLLGYTFQTIERKIEELERLGINDPVTIIDNFPKIIIFDITKRAERLSNLGLNHVSLIEGYPPILLLSNIDRIERLLVRLRELGFKKPELIIELYPQRIIKFEPEIINRSVKRLKKMGFAEPIKILERFYSRGYFKINFKRIQESIDFLKKRGFE